MTVADVMYKSHNIQLSVFNIKSGTNRHFGFCLTRFRRLMLDGTVLEIILGQLRNWYARYGLP